MDPLVTSVWGGGKHPRKQITAFILNGGNFWNNYQCPDFKQHPRVSLKTNSINDRDGVVHYSPCRGLPATSMGLG